MWGFASAKTVVVGERSSLFWSILRWVVEVHVLLSDMKPLCTDYGSLLALCYIVLAEINKVALKFAEKDAG